MRYFRLTSLTIARTVLTMSKPDMSKIGIKRADYKAIKSMDRRELTEYLSRVWKRGYEAGRKSLAVNISPQSENNEDIEG